VNVEATTESPFAGDADTLAIGLFEESGPVLAAGDDLPEGRFGALLESGEAKGRFRHLAVTHLDDRRVILAGLGAPAEFDSERGRVIAALVGRRAAELSAHTLCWAAPPGCGPEIAEALVQGTILGAYRFDRYKPSEAGPGLDRLLVSSPEDLAAPVARTALIAAAQNRARDLANRSPNDLTPMALAAYASELAGRFDTITFEELDGEQIRGLGMGAFAAVAQGSEQDPRLIVLRYEPGTASAETRRLALIGKAVTFDSGGLALKPTASMITMKFDMAGGAAVIEAVAALAEIGAPMRMLAVVGATENLISGRAVRPGDIVTALDGTTIEVNNPDAEGRLVLADCIAFARREGCDAIVDIATLTGGVTLGATYACLMANDDALAQRLQACAQRTGELVWRLPLHPAYAEMVKGRYAQLTNRTERRDAPAIAGAEFLHHFADDGPWAHIDIGAMADDGRAPYLDKGGTGFGVRLLVELALSY
jgi:leucyl aminopeptidase